MNFNPDPNKQAQEVIFSRKISKINHPPLLCNQNLIKSSSSQKHLGMVLGTKLDFNLHIKNVQSKVNKTIGLLRKLKNILSRQSLITIYKSFLRPHLDYGDIIYDGAYNSSFHENIESIHYNAALAIAGAIRGTSKEKIYQELGFESLQQRRWCRKLCCLFKIIKNRSPGYLFKLVPSSTSRYLTRNSDNISQIRTKHSFFKNSFFPSTINEWSNLDPDICNSESVGYFKSKILKFTRPKPNSIYNCHNPKGIGLITRLRLGLSHLHKHKFKHSSQDCLNSLCLCENDVETSSHFLLHCPTYSKEIMSFLNKIKNINYSILELSDTIITKTLLLVDSLLSDSTNTLILNSTIEYVIATKRFDDPIVT